MVQLQTPTKLMDFDYFRYLLNFPRLQVAISRSGSWLLIIRETCEHFDPDTSQCKVHNTSEQPITCQYYNPYQCWYRPNFAAAEPRDLCILTRETFPLWMRHVTFSESGALISAPDFEDSRRLLRQPDITEVGRLSPGAPNAPRG